MMRLRRALSSSDPRAGGLCAAVAMTFLLLSSAAGRAQFANDYVLEWDPVGSLSGSWYDESYDEVYEVMGEYKSPWRFFYYDENGEEQDLGRWPQPWIGSDVVFSRAGTYRVSMAGAEARFVFVYAGDLTLDLQGDQNYWNSLNLGTELQAANLRLSGTGALHLGGSNTSNVRNGLLSLDQSASLESWGSLLIAEASGLQMGGNSGLLVREELIVEGVAVIGGTAYLGVVPEYWFGNHGVLVSGSMLLEDSAQLSASSISVSGHLRVQDDATLHVALPEYASGYATGVWEGGLLELDSSAAVTALGAVRVEGADAILHIQRNHAVAGAVGIYDGGRIQLSDATSFTTTGDMAIGRAPFGWGTTAPTGGTFDLGSSGSGILAATGDDSVLRVQGFGPAETARLSQLTGSGQVLGFSAIHFTGGARYQPGEGTGPLLLAAENVYVGSATYSWDPVSAIHANDVLGIGGHLQIQGGGLVELEESGILSAERITIASDTFASAVLRSRGVIAVASPDATVDLTVGARGLLEAEMGISGRILLESTGRIAATGDLILGDGQSVAGFHMTGGTLDVGAHVVALLDYDGASIEGGTVALGGGTLLSTFQDSIGGTSAIRLGGNAYLGGSGTIASRLLAVGSSYVEVPDHGALTLDTSAEIYEGTTGDFINFLRIGRNGEFRHDAGWDQSVVGMNWLSLESESSYHGDQINLQDGGGIIGSGRVFAEVRGAGVSIDTRGSLYLEEARLTDSAIRLGADVLTYRYGLSLLRSSLALNGGSVRTSNLWSTGGGSTMELTESVVTGHGAIGAEQPIESRGSAFVASGGQLVIEGNLTGNGVLVGDVEVTGSVSGSDTGYAIPNLLVLSGDAVVFGRGRTTFDVGLDFGNGRRLSAPDGVEFGAGAVVRGSGTVAGSVINAGRIEPGNSPGSLLVEGNLTLASTSRLVMELGGTMPGIDYDRIRADGDLIFGGELVLTLAGLVRAGDSFQLFTAGGTMSGAFSSVIFEDSGYAGAFDAQTGQLNVTTAPAAGDADGNGLPDEWEMLHFGATGVDPTADADGDGTSNKFEYIAGTNPVDASSVFRSETWREGSQMILRVATVTGRRYRLMGSAAMAPGSWNEIDAVDGDGNPLEWERPLTGGRYFLRVEVSIAGG
jgi:hypothetical protein